MNEKWYKKAKEVTKAAKIFDRMELSKRGLILLRRLPKFIIFNYSAILEKVKRNCKKNDSKLNLPLCVFIGIAISLAAKAFVLDFYKVKGHSMEPSIQEGRVIAANKLAYGLQNPFKAELLFSWNEPKSGETVLYMYQNYWVVKRCVATGGDALDFDGQNDKYCLRVNGQEIPLTSIQYHKLWTTRAVPQGYILAVGDNAQISHDSRDYGFVPLRNVVARVF